MLQARGGNPPVEGSVALYAKPTMPVGSGPAGMLSTPKMVSVKVCCTDIGPPGAADESVTLTVKVEVPPVVGVP